eukprot:TRINITY_DN3837_c0_g1_i1.p1 TRINITY_DN3837_c0_g1~~TRINITY_DN3837_c0_g1_i1.p1  ORF type:complete len:333 (+),score=42.24 TRINITY_DN3837_c0_g1_i1:32-1000(+)
MEASIRPTWSLLMQPGPWRTLLQTEGAAVHQCYLPPCARMKNFSRKTVGIGRVSFLFLYRHGKEMAMASASDGYSTRKTEQPEFSADWLPKAKPHELLGLDRNEVVSVKSLKAAFRKRVKAFHPDVYKGSPSDAERITKHLVEAYELLLERLEKIKPRRGAGDEVTLAVGDLDPFHRPECEANNVFVNEFQCLGRGCASSCVVRAPFMFYYAEDTNCARAQPWENMSFWRGPDGDDEDDDVAYAVQMAVGQCPVLCIHYVTPRQNFALQALLTSVVENVTAPSEAAVEVEGLLAIAEFENGRYQAQPSRPQPNSTTEFVDWY